MSMAGAQLVERVGAVLRQIGSSASHGVTTAEVATATGLPRSTAQRVLAALASEGLVDRDPARGRWFLGPEMFLLGAVAAERYDVTQAARETLAALAEQTGESAFFSARRGEETVCLAGREGSFPLRSHVLHDGIRFPLGVASAGLAILAHLPLPDAEAYVRRRAAELVASPGLDEACRSAARLAAACAGCHVETRAAPVFDKPPAVPPDQDTVEAHMARHLAVGLEPLASRATPSSTPRRTSASKPWS